MDDVKLKELGEGRFELQGPLTFATVTSALEQSRHPFAKYDRLTVDLSGVDAADSAALALLLEWINWARHYVREIRFEHIPPQILAIARISEVAELLSAGERWVSQEAATAVLD
jgi:phospholipid transport system transporter-binding protein